MARMLKCDVPRCPRTTPFHESGGWRLVRVYAIDERTGEAGDFCEEAMICPAHDKKHDEMFGWGK